MESSKRSNDLRFAKGCFGFQDDLEKHNIYISKNAGTQQPWVFLLKMIILGCFGVPPFKETPIYNLSSDETMDTVALGAQISRLYQSCAFVKSLGPSCWCIVCFPMAFSLEQNALQQGDNMGT